MVVQRFGGRGTRVMQAGATKTKLDILAENFTSRLISDRAKIDPTLAPIDTTDWLVSTKAAIAVTNAPIQPYQRKFERVWSEEKYMDDYGYLPTEAYYQLEANILASMPYLPYDLDDATAADWEVFMDDRHYTVSPVVNPFRLWENKFDYKVGDIVRADTIGPNNSIYRAKVDHKSAYEWSKNPKGTNPANWDLWIKLDPDFDNDYKPGKMYAKDEGAYAADPITGIIWLYKNLSDHVSPPTFDAVESANWEKIQPIFMFMFRITEQARKGGTYPASWTRENILYDWGDEQYEWVLKWMRKTADLLNVCRWVLLTKRFAEQAYTNGKDNGVSKGNIYRDKSPTVRWAPGIGWKIVPPLELILWARNADLSIIFSDIGSLEYWQNSLGNIYHTAMSDFDIFGTPQQSKTIDQVSNTNEGIPNKRPTRFSGLNMGYSYAISANIPTATTPHHRRYHNGSHPTNPNRFSIDPKWEDLLDEVANNDWKITSRMNAQAPPDDRNYIRNEYPGYSNLLGLMFHETFGHGNAGIDHKYPDTTGTQQQKDMYYLGTTESTRLGYVTLPTEAAWYDYSNRIQYISADAYGGYWSIFNLEIYYHILKDRNNRDYFGKRFTKLTGFNFVYAKKGEII